MKKIKGYLREMHKSAQRIEKMRGHSNGLDRCVICDMIKPTKGGICLECKTKKS